MSGDCWRSETESPKAWMSVRDADLYEALLHRLADRCRNGTLHVVEWGAGRSTIWYTQFLEALGASYVWLALEHDRAFFERNVASALRARPEATIAYEEAVDDAHIAELLKQYRVVVVVYNAGDLRPQLPGRERDRYAKLDGYVSLPRRTSIEVDVAVVDGRKRRRCLLEAAQIIGLDGYVLLHDAWRRHYQCAWTAFAAGRRFGDTWWIGSQRTTDFADILPRHAFERHWNPTT
jgi:hypothetical protein